MNTITLFERIIGHLKLWNVNIQLALSETVPFDGEEVGGFFDQRTMTLGVATRDEDWFLVLVHEYCHFLQWKEGKWSKTEEIEEFTKRTDWVYKKQDLPDEDVLRITRAIQACELDCEQRTVGLLTQQDIPFDIKDYIRTSNAYVLTYEYERRFRKPCPTGTMNLVKHLMPDTFITDLESIPTGFIELIDKEIESNESAPSG